MKKRFLSVLLCLVLVVGLLPTAAFAEGSDTDKAIRLGTSGISDPTKTTVADRGNYYAPNSYVYFGVNSGDNNTPIKWRVLDADTANDGKTSGMFLLSEYLLASGVYFNSDSSKGNVYQGSDAQTWCSTFATNISNFSTAEQGAMLGVAKTDSAESNLYSMSWDESSLTADGDKLFFLSVRELADYVGNYNTALGLLATDTAQSAGGWWLRSPDASSTHYAGVVDYFGSVGSLDEYNDWAARPAFNLNLNSVLFTSAAEGGKSASGMEGGLTAVEDYDGSEWKLTLEDTSRKFSVDETTGRVSGAAGDTVTLQYDSATTGSNEYISAMLVDNSDNVLYYGRVKNITNANEAIGTVSIKIPEGLVRGTYTLRVFNEQYNGDYKTDYASAFEDVTLTVTKKTPTLTLSANSGTVYSNAGTTSFTYTYDGDGTVSATSSDDSVATVFVDAESKTVTATILKADTATITVSADEGENYAAAAPQTYELTVKQYVAPSYNDSDPTYAVTVNKVEHGTVTASRRYAERGERVTLTVEPDKGWTLETLTVADRNGKKIDLAIVTVGEKYTFQMPSSQVTVEATFMEDNTMLNYFVNVSAGDYYYDAVLWAAVNGITSGVDALHFAPDAPCTRAQAVTFLWRAAGSPAPKATTMPFTDVPVGSYYYDAVLWAVENGITKGTSATEFSPNESCSRAQIVTFLYRSEQVRGNGMDGAWMFQNPFTDVDAESYYGEAVMWAIANNVTEGTSSTTFSPDANCTRAQIVTFLWRCMK